MAAELSKMAYDLAKLAVGRKHMRKQAQGAESGLSPTARTALIGALLGGTGTGVVSSLYGRPGKSVIRDMLLGAAVGGVGGAAGPIIAETFGDIEKEFTKPKLTWPQWAQSQISDVYKGADPLVAGGVPTTLGIAAGLGHYRRTAEPFEPSLTTPYSSNPTQQAYNKAKHIFDRRARAAKTRGRIGKSTGVGALTGLGSAILERLINR